MKILDVPYISQWDSNASYQKSDCFPVSVCMLLAYYGINIDPDFLSERIGVQGGTNFNQVQNSLKDTGHTLLYKKGQTMDDLRSSIDRGIPFGVTVNYGMLPNRQDTYQGAHLMVVTGYDQKDVYVNDPNFWGNRRNEGKNKKYPISAFLKSWQDTSQGNFSGNYFYFDKKIPETKLAMILEEDVPTEIEDKYSLKANAWYNKHWTGDEFIKNLILSTNTFHIQKKELETLKKDNANLIKEIEKLKQRSNTSSKTVEDYTIYELILLIFERIKRK